MMKIPIRSKEWNTYYLSVDQVKSFLKRRGWKELEVKTQRVIYTHGDKGPEIVLSPDESKSENQQRDEMVRLMIENVEKLADKYFMTTGEIIQAIQKTDPYDLIIDRFMKGSDYYVSSDMYDHQSGNCIHLGVRSIWGLKPGFSESSGDPEGATELIFDRFWCDSSIFKCFECVDIHLNYWRNYNSLHQKEVVRMEDLGFCNEVIVELKKKAFEELERRSENYRKNMKKEPAL